MSRKRHDDLLGRAEGSSTGTRRGGKAVWDTGSSLYDSYELAAVRRLLDRRLLAGGGTLPLATDGNPPPVERTGKRIDKQQAVVVIRPRRKVTLRALFRAVATWASQPRQAPLACACAGMVHAQKGAAVEPDVPSHGEV